VQLAESLSRAERRESIRFLMRELAYHQAGHVVMRLFTGFLLGKFPPTSIMLNKISSDILYSGGPAWESWLRLVPPALKRVNTQMVLFYLLAGCGAQNVARKIRKAKQRPLLDEDMPLEYRSADVRQATLLAESMATPDLPASHFLAQAKKWTSKMFKRPDVQRAVSKVAGQLLKRGTLAPRELERACREILWLGTRLPEWERCGQLNSKEGQMLRDICRADDGTFSCAG
jgi:hypothetical protein